ncbi:hypothetical protein B0H11DRAFT_1906146 [Mycena galericulata]|nr:hypothetical protein B0H11DRAFT_1906146 [Mycena galericulata]
MSNHLDSMRGFRPLGTDPHRLPFAIESDEEYTIYFNNHSEYTYPLCSPARTPTFELSAPNLEGYTPTTPLAAYKGPAALLPLVLLPGAEPELLCVTRGGTAELLGVLSQASASTLGCVTALSLRVKPSEDLLNDAPLSALLAHFPRLSRLAMRVSYHEGAAVLDESALEDVNLALTRILSVPPALRSVMIRWRIKKFVLDIAELRARILAALLLQAVTGRVGILIPCLWIVGLVWTSRYEMSRIGESGVDEGVEILHNPIAKRQMYM